MIGLIVAGYVAGTAVASADVQALNPYDVANPAVGYLNPALLAAVQQATSAAAADGITMTITSGWRSPQFQQQLLDDAVCQPRIVATEEPLALLCTLQLERFERSPRLGAGAGAGQIGHWNE